MSIEMTPALHALDWIGSALGILGAYVLALNMRVSRYGWIAFLAANVAYIALTKELGIGGMLVQQLAYMGSSLFGFYRSFLAPSRHLRTVEAKHLYAWDISKRLAALPSTSSLADLSELILQAQMLHSSTAERASRLVGRPLVGRDAGAGSSTSKAPS